MIPVDDLLSALAAQRPLFHSEADFQHSFAWLLHHSIRDSSVRLEIPLACGSSIYHVDILVTTGGERIAIELKYKTKQMAATVNGEAFSLGNHAANDHGRYDYLRDVERVETLVSAGVVASGFAILLTNDHLYWISQQREVNDLAFHIADGTRISGQRAWAPGASKGSIAKREHPIALRETHECKWRDYSQVGTSRGGQFRCLILQTRLAAV